MVCKSCFNKTAQEEGEREREKKEEIREEEKKGEEEKEKRKREGREERGGKGKEREERRAPCCTVSHPVPSCILVSSSSDTYQLCNLGQSLDKWKLRTPSNHLLGK